MQLVATSSDTALLNCDHAALFDKTLLQSLIDHMRKRDNSENSNCSSHKHGNLMNIYTIERDF
eukprot:3217983-Amphidinium_carterae.2